MVIGGLRMHDKPSTLLGPAKSLIDLHWSTSSMLPPCGCIFPLKFAINVGGGVLDCTSSSSESLLRTCETDGKQPSKNYKIKEK